MGGRGQGVSTLVPHRGGEARGQGPSVPPRSLQGPDGCCEEYLQAGGGDGKAEGWAGGSHDPLAGSTHHAYRPTCPSVGGWVAAWSSSLKPLTSDSRDFSDVLEGSFWWRKGFRNTLVFKVFFFFLI